MRNNRMSKHKKKIEKELNDYRQVVINEIKVVADILGIEVNEVTARLLTKYSDKISDWKLRQLPSFATIRDTAYPIQTKDLKSIYDTKLTKSYMDKLEKSSAMRMINKESIQTWTEQAVKSLKLKKEKVKKPKVSKSKRNMTVELLLSDWHIGKKTKKFDVVVAEQRIDKYMEVFWKEVSMYEKKFNIEKIIIASVGDLLENYLMHDLESAIGCEFNNPEQMRVGMELLFNKVIAPISREGYKVDFIGVTGNHDRPDRSKTKVDPGKNHLTWPIYHALKMLSEVSGFKNTKFHIPENYGMVLDIYGSNVLYEHGDNLKSKAAKPCDDHMAKRSSQLGIMIDMMRSGHFHEYTVYGRGKVIINESLAGQDGYSETSGYTSHAGQTINYYIENKDRPNSFYHSFPVYLG